MSEVLMKPSERVKTLSIIDTISELAQNENEASRLTLPSPIRNNPHSPNPRSPRKHPGSANNSGHASLQHFQNGYNASKSPDIRTFSPHKENDGSGKHSIPPALISPSLRGSKSSPRTPNFTLYEIDHKQKNLEFMSSTPTSPPLNLSSRLKETPPSPFNGGARSKLGSLRIIRGSSKDQTKDTTTNAKQNVSSEVSINTSDTRNNSDGRVNTHNLSEQNRYPREKFLSSSARFGTPRQQHQPFVTLDSSTVAIETKNGKVQTPDWIREIFLHAKRGSKEKLVS